jgi:hypothetical protein
MNDIIPHWDYSVTTPVIALDNIQPIIQQIIILENQIKLVQKQREKERLKAERIAKRKASGDDDEDEDEEEEEPEEEDDDEETKRRKPLHSLIIETKLLKSSVLSEIHKLIAYDLPSQDIYDLTKQSLLTALDTIFEAQDYAINQAGINEMMNNGAMITTVESPFSSEEGKNQWNTILQTNSSSSEPIDPKKAKEKPKNAAPVTTITQQQLDYYHHLFHDKLKENLIDTLSSNILATSYHTIQQYVESSYHQKVNNNDVVVAPPKVISGSQLTNVATWRASDLLFVTPSSSSNSDNSDNSPFVIYSFNSSQLIPNPEQSYPISAYSIYETEKQLFCKEINEIITSSSSSSSSPKGIILLNESIPGFEERKSNLSIEKEYDSIKTINTK